MPSRRVKRLNEQFRRELSTLIRREVRDPRVGMAMVTGAEVAPDLSFARIFVRPAASQDGSMADSEDWAETLAGLEAAAPFLRRELGQQLHIRRAPELRFEADRTLEKAARIESILDEVIPEDEATEAGESEGTSDGDVATEDPEVDEA